VLLTRSPLSHREHHTEAICSKCFVRLACLRHAASVHPEPGSNSPRQSAGFKGSNRPNAHWSIGINRFLASGLSRFSRVQREFLLCPNCLGLSSSVPNAASLDEAAPRPPTRPGNPAGFRNRQVLMQPDCQGSRPAAPVRGLRKRKSQHTRPPRKVSSGNGADLPRPPGARARQRLRDASATPQHPAGRRLPPGPTLASPRAAACDDGAVG
jgi:hypothetical protein